MTMSDDKEAKEYTVTLNEGGNVTFTVAEPPPSDPVTVTPLDVWAKFIQIKT